MKNTALFIQKASIRKFLTGLIVLSLLIMIQHCAFASGGNCQFDGWVKTEAGAGIGGVTVKVYLSDDTYVTQTQTASDGGWNVSGLAGGTYYLTFEKNGWTFAATPSGKYPINESNPLQQCDVVRGAESSTTTAPTITSVSVTPTSASAGDMFTFTVRTSDATAVAIYDANKSYIRLMEADTSSRYTYDYVPTVAGTQTLYFRAENGIGTLSDYSSKSITVTETVAGSLNGRAQDANSNGLQGVTIAIYQNGTRVTTATTNASGAWSAANLIANVAYNLVATKSGYSFSPEEVQIRASATSTTVQTFVGTPVQEDIPIDEAHFPDDVFREWCLQQTWGADGVLTATETNTIFEIGVIDQPITSLKGIEYFGELVELSCSYCNVTEIDVSKNLKLRSLWLDENPIVVLDVSKNLLLEELACRFCGLSTIDVSANVNLRWFNCGTYGLTEHSGGVLPDEDSIPNCIEILDVSNNPNLKSLGCSGNPIKQIDVSHNPLLECFECIGTQLTELNLSNNPVLDWLECDDNDLSSLNLSTNKLLRVLRCSNNPKLTQLDLSNLTWLESIRCTYDNMCALDISNNCKLSWLACDYNQLTELNTANNPALEHLYCSYNKITSLSLENNQRLLELVCNNNELLELDVSGNVELEINLICHSNHLRLLNLSHNTKEYYLSHSPQTVACPASAIQVSGTNYLIDMKQIVGSDGCGLITMTSPANTWNPQTGTLTVPSTTTSVQYQYDTQNASADPMDVTLNLTAPSQPAISFTTYKSTYAANEAITFSITIASGSRVRLVVDGTAYDEYPANGNTFTVTRAFTSTGVRSVQFQVGDNSSWGEYSAAKSITIVANAPQYTVLLRSPLNNDQFVLTDAIYAQVDNPQNGYVQLKVTQPNGTVLTCPTSGLLNETSPLWNIKPTQVGTYTLQAFVYATNDATDTLANSSDVVTVVVKQGEVLPLQTPVITLTSPHNLGQALSVSWSNVPNATSYVATLYDAQNVSRYTITETGLSAVIPSIAMPLSGTYTLEVCATAIGYSDGVARKEFVVQQATQPTITSFSMQPNPVAVNENVSFVVNAQNATSVQMYADGQPVVDCIKTITNGTVSFTRAFSQAGIHSIAFEARDDAGNSAMSSEQTITIRPKPPTVTQQTYVTEWRKADGTPCKWTVDVRKLIGIANLSKAKDFSWGKYNVSTGILQSDSRPDQVITYTYLTGDAVTPENFVQLEITDTVVAIDDDPSAPTIVETKSFDATTEGFCFCNTAQSLGQTDNLGYFNGGPFVVRVYLQTFRNLAKKTTPEQTGYMVNVKSADPDEEQHFDGECDGIAILSVLAHEKKIPLATSYFAYTYNSLLAKTDKTDLNVSDYSYCQRNDTFENKAYYSIRGNEALQWLIYRLGALEYSKELWEWARLPNIHTTLATENKVYISDHGIMSYGSYAPVIERLINKNDKTPYCIGLQTTYVADGKKQSCGHMLIRDTSRPVELLDDGCYKVYVYDPNAPRVSSVEGINYNSTYYETPNYLKLNLEKGKWSLHYGSTNVAYLAGEQYTANPFGILKRSRAFYLLDLSDIPDYFWSRHASLTYTFKEKCNTVVVQGETLVASQICVRHGAIVSSDVDGLMPTTAADNSAQFSGKFLLGEDENFSASTEGEMSIFMIGEHGALRYEMSQGNGTVAFSPSTNTVTMQATTDATGSLYVGNVNQTKQYINAEVSGTIPAQVQITLGLTSQGVLRVAAPVSLRLTLTLYTDRENDPVVIPNVDIASLNNISLDNILNMYVLPPVVPPKTGDSFPVYWLLVLCLISGIGVWYYLRHQACKKKF